MNPKEIKVLFSIWQQFKMCTAKCFDIVLYLLVLFGFELKLKFSDGANKCQVFIEGLQHLFYHKIKLN